jgi:hypothetical protein
MTVEVKARPLGLWRPDHVHFYRMDPQHVIDYEATIVEGRSTMTYRTLDGTRRLDIGHSVEDIDELFSKACFCAFDGDGK